MTFRDLLPLLDHVAEVPKRKRDSGDTHSVTSNTLRPFIMSSFDSLSSSKDDVDPEVASFLQMESQKAELQAQVHKLADVCWEQCIDRPRDKLDSKTETCVSNCVERFIDTSLTIATRFQKLLQGAAANM